MATTTYPFEQISEYKWQIPKTYMRGMRVPGIIYADSQMLDHIVRDKTPTQVANVACLPGIVKASIAMPDIHWGYGFPIGGVAAMDISGGGVISPGGVGSDINCGVRLVRTNLTVKEIKDKLEQLINALFVHIPSGLGSRSSIRLTDRQLQGVLSEGTRWAVKQGYGWNDDIECTEEFGQMAKADPDSVSQRALERGRNQLGTLGSGNHFLEIQVVEVVYEKEIAEKFGLFEGQITVMIHSGSRGLGYQVCDDYVAQMGKAVQRYGISLPDRQLACAPFDSKEGRMYFGAMAAAANYAWANRQCIMHFVRSAFEKTFGKPADKLDMRLVYDVAHNIAKVEKFKINEKQIEVCVHRKGATRAFPAGHEVLPAIYKDSGQPVIIPGDMGTTSYVLVGTPLCMDEAFGTACHGAGRVLSRSQAIRLAKGRAIDKELLQNKGIIVRSAARETLAEEMPEAYKDVTKVVDVLQHAGLAKKIVKLRPLGVVKG